jgi:hypothetical protein
MSATTFSRLCCQGLDCCKSKAIALLLLVTFQTKRCLNFVPPLGNTDWNSVANKTNVDEAYEEFWNIYKELYNSKFPLKRIRFNKNKHKIHNFMTNGLLISRNRKKILHSASICDPSAQNKQLYKNYKTVYQRVIRGAKKLYFTNKLRDNAGNPKKTRETLKEILGKSRNTESVKLLNINGVSSLNPAKIANHFNTFLPPLGSKSRIMYRLLINNRKSILIMGVKFQICCIKIPPLSI